MNQSLQLSALHVPVGSLDAYIHHVNQIPMLSPEEELACARRFHEEGDLEAARRLVLAHLRYVVRVARGYLGYGLPLGDLVQEGNIGLMKAVKRFDPTIGVRLVSFAIHWIKAEIHEYVVRNWRIVKIATTKAQRKLFFNLRQARKRLGWLSPEEVDAIAGDLSVTPEDVRLMEQRMYAANVSFDATDEDDDSPSQVPERYLQTADSDPLHILEQEDTRDLGRESMFHALDCLDGRSQDIIRQRWLVENKATLHELADKYQVSAERVRQLEKNAMKKLRDVMMQ